MFFWCQHHVVSPLDEPHEHNVIRLDPRGDADSLALCIEVGQANIDTAAKVQLRRSLGLLRKQGQ